MRILLTALNAKYIHSNLALRYLKSFCQDIANIEIKEFTINDHSEAILAEIYKTKADIVAFSCYIWNIVKTLEIAENLKKVSPATTIVLGGPEVSYDPLEIFTKHNYIDYIIFGEGEETFRELADYLVFNKGRLSEIAGLAYDLKGQIYQNQTRELINNLDSIPFPYPGDLAEFNNKIIYYESSRGCPFQCQYCLSSTIKGVRFFSLDRVKKDLRCFIKAGIRQVKFVDRTFNCNRERALDIMRYIVEQGGNTGFHFEIAADLLDDETIDFLATVPPGLFQFEIGIQSTNEYTLEIIQRQMNLAQVKENVRKIRQPGNIHQHLDLIAGLPGEDLPSFIKSFNEVYELQPDKLQLGFLKLLKGSGIRARADIYDYQYTGQPPYEVLSNHLLSYDEITTLKKIEDLLERYGNSHRFDHSIKYIVNIFESAFQMYEALAVYWEQHNYHLISHSNEALYKILFDFYVSVNGRYPDVIRDLLKFDFLLQNRSSRLPEFMARELAIGFHEKCWELLKNNQWVSQYLPDYAGLSAKQIIKRVHFEPFTYNISNIVATEAPMNHVIAADNIIILFDYKTSAGINKFYFI